MSILLSKRLKTNKSQFEAIAIRIFTEVLEFCSRLSVKKQNMIGNKTVHLSMQIMDLVIEANNIYINSEMTYNLRYSKLIEAKSKIAALDTHLTAVYMALRTNPQGAFTKSNGDTISSNKAKCILDKMSESLGRLLDEEINELNKILEYDKRKFKQLNKK